ncbi:MAG TPA: hypothetical protein VHC69_20575 [Polyangiaceae bacterium]|nr:hypothetical protein [Polyangiaceae bacterium]
MSDARDRRRQYVRSATASLCGIFALCGGAELARAADAEASASISLGGDSTAAASAEGASPEADSAPKEEPVDPRIRNPANYEFAFVSVAAYQTWALAGSVLYFGAGGGLGPPLYRIAKIGHNSLGWDPDLQIAYANVFLRIAPVRYVDIDLGPIIGLGSSLFNVPDAPQSTFSYGGYVDLRIGSPTIKLGPRFEYDRDAHSTFSENGWRLTPLLLRVVH